MQLKDGGQLESFGKSTNKNEILTHINFEINGENCINVWLKSNLGNESLTYLTLDEAVKLKRELQNQINLLTAL